MGLARHQRRDGVCALDRPATRVATSRRMQAELVELLEPIRRNKAKILVLTGAGISAESGIPTFRGHEGYWVIGSKNYIPEEMATHAMFERYPEQVWRWYLLRFGICAKAQPNRAHRALVALERAFSNQFTLVTQNIDGLHRRAGSNEARTFCIHGDAAYVRCADDCGAGLLPLPAMGDEPIELELTAEQRRLLRCPKCGGWLRPQVLWFDECYDEANYRAESAMGAALEAELLLVVGTSGATSLPMHIGVVCQQRGVTIIDINPESNPLSVLAQQSKQGCAVRNTASDALPGIVEYLTGEKQGAILKGH